jgi:spore coat protein I
MEGLALFHKASQGYEPPEEARVSTKLAKWPDQYRSMLKRMTEWKTVSQQKAGTAVYDAYLKWIDAIIALGEKAIRYLESSRYSELSCPGSSSVVMCHQDFGKGNALLTDKGICVLDLDGVTFELAARDLRKIILKTMENQSEWNETVMKNIITWYEKGSKLTRDERQMVYIDCLFPHAFFGSVKNQFQKNKAVKPSSIEIIGRLEMSKQEILSALIEGE